jgi:hypothetical protein
MSDDDGTNIDNFLPFSLREIPIARAILNGKKDESVEFNIEVFML